jgi:hypothetical protein
VFIAIHFVEMSLSLYDTQSQKEDTDPSYEDNRTTDYTNYEWE